MIPSQSHVQGMLHRLAASQDLIYPDLDACKAAGFISVGTGLLLRAGAKASTEVWSIEPTSEGQLKLLLRSDLGYDPELRSATIERRVIAAKKDAVDTPYGQGVVVSKTKEGSPVVAFSNNGRNERFILNASDVKPVKDEVRTAVVLEAKDPENTSSATYLQQYFYEAYGSDTYASELTKTFGDLWPE